MGTSGNVRKRKPGGGRKSNAERMARLLAVADKGGAADEALAHCYSVMIDVLADPALRLKAAREIMDRVWGRPAQQVTVRDWRDKIIELLRAGKVTPDDVQRELGNDLATELFNAAGVPIGENSKA